MSTKTRICPSCGIEKEHSEFNNSRSTKDGLQCYCKDCIKVKQGQKKKLKVKLKKNVSGGSAGAGGMTSKLLQLPM